MTDEKAREDFMNDVYNTLDFLPTNNEANRIIDSFDRVTSELEQQPCEMTVNEYRNRLMDAFHNADCDELIAVVVRPEESEFKQLEWLLKNHYHKQKQQPCEDWYDVPSNEMTLEQARQAVKDLRKKLAEYLEQNPCEDAISRQAVIKLLSYDWANRPAHKAVESVRNLPPVTPKEKTAEWYEEDGCEGACEGYMSAGVICSQCGELLCGHIGNYDFCPNCGARMVSE